MPNGDREPYRFTGLRTIFDSEGEADVPSTVHTSDSDDTFEEKRAFHVSCARLRLLVAVWKRRARSLRRARQLCAGRLLPRRFARQWVYARIAPFL